MRVIEFLKHSVTNNASDLHLSAECSPLWRMDGVLTAFEDKILSIQEAEQLLLDTLTEPQRQELIKNKNIDFCLDVPGLARFRANIFQHQRGWAGTFRLIPTQIPSLDQLGLPEVIKKMTQFDQGLVLITGATGSGKSTTSAAMLHEVNRQSAKHIITLEDPIEFIHQPLRSLVHQRELGPQMTSFDEGLRAALREDPDVIFVGELRDLTTIHLALTAAETGHLVLATLHTMSAVKTIHRIIDVFPANEKATIRAMLADSLQAVVAQELLKKSGGGRVAVQEIMLCTPAIRHLIREEKIVQMASVIQTSVKEGMQTAEMHRAILKNRGVLTE